MVRSENETPTGKIHFHRKGREKTFFDGEKLFPWIQSAEPFSSHPFRAGRPRNAPLKTSLLGLKTSGKWFFLGWSLWREAVHPSRRVPVRVRTRRRRTDGRCHQRGTFQALRFNHRARLLRPVTLIDLASLPSQRYFYALKFWTVVIEQKTCELFSS